MIAATQSTDLTHRLTFAMKAFLLPVLLFAQSAACGQAVKEMAPVLGRLVDVSPRKEAEFIKNQPGCAAIWPKINAPSDTHKLTTAERVLLRTCSETKESSWQIIGSECSWYCGGGQDTTTASSCLKAGEGVAYDAKNIQDLSYRTAWIEGVPGYGIGESVTYHFPPQNPRITEIIVVNGYVKSPTVWQENSRVKKLRMYVNNQPFAILQLADSRREQHFKFAPLGNAPAKWQRSLPWWTIKFEILDVYKGDKYDDTALTEIYFDGIDVH